MKRILMIVAAAVLTGLIAMSVVLIVQQAQAPGGGIGITLGENGAEIKNRFADCDLNYWQSGAGTYLTRSDWAGTYPTEQTVIAASAEMIDALSGEISTTCP